MLHLKIGWDFQYNNNAHWRLMIIFMGLKFYLHDIKWITFQIILSWQLCSSMIKKWKLFVFFQFKIRFLRYIRMQSITNNAVEVVQSFCLIVLEIIIFRCKYCYNIKKIYWLYSKISIFQIILTVSIWDIISKGNYEAKRPPLIHEC